MSFILASQSASRRAMLDAAGIAYRAVPADLDESATMARWAEAGATPGAMARELACEKARIVSAHHPGQAVAGSDSIVSVKNRLFEKPTSREAAAEHLRFFSGETIQLDSGLALVRDGVVIKALVDSARLHVRPLSEGFIARYLDAEWPAIAGCVGCFRMEALGPQLFSHVEGSHFTILGMPLLPLLAMLRDEGLIDA